MALNARARRTEDDLLSAGVGYLQNTGNQAKKIHWACTVPPDVKISQPGNKLDSRGKKQKTGQTKLGVAAVSE